MGFLASLGYAFPLQAVAQQVRPTGLRRIGFLPGGDPSLIAAFKDELGRLGYVDGENIILETRIPRPNSSDLVTQVAELVHMDLELIAVVSLPAALLVREANPAMPMVVATCPGMVSNGFAQSLEHPGGNVTGMDELPPGVTAKRLHLLKTAAPSVTRVALLSTTPGHGGHAAQLADAEQVAGALGMGVKVYRVISFNELEPALAAMIDDRMNGLATFQGALAFVNRKLIVDFAAEHRLPAVYQATAFAESGGLMAWAPDLKEQFRVAARNVDKILKGTKAGDIPIQYPPRYYLTINTHTAADLGLTFPETLIAEADQVLR
jgi:putative ABC transport system substrate-binding protein